MAATPASMLKIVGYGLQDRERLNIPHGNPDTRYYSFVYRKRTRWASQWRRVDFDNLADFGRRATVTLPILGELITRATLVVELPDIYGPQVAVAGIAGLAGPFWSWTNGVGHALCSNVEMAISGQVIDRLDSRLMEVLDEQRGPVEHFDSANQLIGRNPSNYTDKVYRGTTPTQTRPQTVEVLFPFWWNRGIGPQALPIQALAKEKVQLTVNFRPVQQCVFTSSFVADYPVLPGAGPLPTFAGCPFYDNTGAIIPSAGTMPTDWHFTDAYWIVEYVSLEDREAAAFRQADLQIPIEQHLAVPVFPTSGAPKVRIPIKQSGLVRDMMWVAQRSDAPDYNAYFLFSRDLGLGLTGLNQGIWWPDAQLPNWDYGDGFIRPAFSDRRSDPILSAALQYRGRVRFEMEGPSFFRSLMPALNCRRCPLIDRYIYRYDFGFWPTGGLAETLFYHEDEVRGAANWDKLPQRELLLTMNQECGSRVEWIEGAAITWDAGSLIILEDEFEYGTEAFYVELNGAGGTLGAYVKGTINWQNLRSIPGYKQTLLRCVPGGSVAIVVEKLDGTYTWIAVAGAGGGGVSGAAGSAVTIGGRGGDNVRTHVASATGGGGGGGTMALGDAGVGLGVGGGAANGIPMPTNNAGFVTTLASTGGVGAAVGGDGYYGGGAGTLAGGGGGSYVSTYITEVDSSMRPAGSPTASSITIRTLTSKPVSPQPMDVYIWLTTYNLLRITAGRAALLFSV
jgi:hypothetical protein